MSAVEDPLSSYRKKKVLDKIRRDLMKKDLVFSYDKDTKRTYRFEEEGDAHSVGTLYVQKHMFQGKAPEKLRVSIEWD